MAIRTIEQAFEAISEKVKGLEKRLEQISNQRRLQVVDQFGIEYIGTSNVEKTEATYVVSISPDKVYLERFQFKVFLIDNDDNPRNFKVFINDIEITELLIEQAERIGGRYMGIGDRPDKSIYPKNALTGDNVNGSFDLIDISNTMYNDDNYSEDDAEEITEAGIKKIRIVANREFTASILLYLKYSHINR